MRRRRQVDGAPEAPDHARWPPSHADEWKSLHDVQDPDAVAAYIAPYPDIPGLLQEAFGRIRSSFPDSATPRLAMQRNPEEGDEWLTHVISVPAADREAGSRLDHFDDDWWLDAAPHGEPCDRARHPSSVTAFDCHGHPARHEADQRLTEVR